MDEFVARHSLGRLLAMLAGSIGFVALGLWIAGAFGPPPSPGKELWGWISAVFFGACAVAAAFRLRDTEDQVRISHAGIYTRQWSDTLIPWAEIDDVTVWEYRRQRSIILHLRNPERFPSNRLLGRIAAANRALTGGDIPISMAGTNRGFADAMDAIARLRPQPR